MGSTSVNMELSEVFQPDDGKGTIRVIVADTQAIFRAGLRKIFALEDDIRVVGQAETFDQAIAAIQKFSADVVIFEAALAPNPADAVSDLLRQNASCRLVVVLQEPDQEMTLELFRRGAHSIVSREVEPEVLVECLRRVAQGEPWLENSAVAWVLNAYRTQGLRPTGSRPKVSLTPKESLIVSCVTQGMKNKEIALRVGTTEQVVKNYLRKVYDKLGVADRLELALYCLSHRVVDGVAPAKPAQPTNGHAAAAPENSNAAAAGSRS
jgi:DNA-binding NarL/FixJ family response regulator